jgi:hypothetical protein
METVCSFETPGTTFSPTECCVPEGVCLWQSQLTSSDVACRVLYRGDYVSVNIAAFYFADNIYLAVFPNHKVITQ